MNVSRYNKLYCRKNKTYETLYGLEKAKLLKLKHSERLLGKSYIERFGKVKANKIRRQIYRNRFIRKKVFCKFCKKVLIVAPCNTRRFCSMACAIRFRIGKHLSKKHRQDISKANTGRKHPLCEILKMAHSSKGHTMCKKSRIAISKKAKKRWKENPDSFLGSYTNKRTKPEKIVNRYIKQNNLPYKYTGNGKFWITLEGKHINPDFINISVKKQFIEIQGCYWHCCKKHCRHLNSEFANERQLVDEHKKSLLKKHGYSVIYIWEHEIYDNSYKKILDETNSLHCSASQ